MKSRGNAIRTQLSPEEVFLCLCFCHVQGDLGTWQGLDMQLGDHGWGMSDLKSQILLVTGPKKYVKKITDIATIVCVGSFNICISFLYSHFT